MSADELRKAAEQLRSERWPSGPLWPALADLLEEVTVDFHDMGSYETCTSIGSAALAVARLINGTTP